MDLMRIPILASIAVVSLTACAPAPAPPATGARRPPADSIVLERTQCFGTCPAYRLRIDRAADVVFESRNPGEAHAVARHTVASWVPDSLTAHLARIGFDQLPDEIAGSALCPDRATDHPTITVSVFSTSVKRVVYYTGCYLATDHSTAPVLVA